MNRAQKIAWVFVGTTSLAVVVTIAFIAILYFRFGMPKALYGFGAIGVAGLGGFAPLFIKKDKGKVTFDERDKLINKRATLAGFTGAYMFVIAACVTPFFILGPQGNISVKWLAQIPIGACVITFFAHSIAILSQYGWRNKNYE